MQHLFYYGEKKLNNVCENVSKANLHSLNVLYRMFKYFVLYIITFSVSYEDLKKKSLHVVIIMKVSSIISRFPLLILITVDLTLCV